MSTVASHVIPQEQASTAVRARIESVDLARGLAVALMILSHGVNALLDFGAFAAWGLVPVHAITKFSSSLFFIVFGTALAIAFVPKTHAPDWPARRNRLLRRAVIVLLWYKALTFIELYDTREWAEVRATLLYQDFPSYVEILGFYAIALLWIPWLLPAWRRAPAWLRWVSPLLAIGLCWFVQRQFAFGGVGQVVALIVEHPDYYTWGQLSRLPLVLLGLLLGGVLLRVHHDNQQRVLLGAGLTLAGLVALGAFAQLTHPDTAQALQGVARNAGKHPPETLFTLFSVGGALLLLGLCVAGGNLLAAALRPLTVIGTDALMAFIVHITVIFVVLRDWLDMRDNVSYEEALGITLPLIAFTALWIWGWQRVSRALRRRA